MQLVAVDWHVYRLLAGTTLEVAPFGQPITLEAEALALGALGLARVIPIVIFALLGGMLADTRDRRRMMILAQTVMAVVAATLAAVELTEGASLALLYLATSATAAASAFDNPSRQSLVPNLVPREHLANAVSLNTLLWQIGTITGPAVAGILIARAEIGLVYAANAVSFGAVLLALLRMHYRGGAAAVGTGIGWGPLVEGLQFVRSSRIIWGTMLLDFFATFFGSARTMLPIIAGEVLHVGPAGYGLLAGAQAVGALLAGAVVSLRPTIRRQGPVLLISVALYGLATALFGVSQTFAVSYVLFALTGAADLVSTVIRGTLRQLLTPDRLRGRMTSVNMMFFMGGPQLGELEAGLVAAFLGAPFAIVTGGVATVVLTGWVAWRYPRLRRYGGEE
jgi:MFS family permease